MSDERAGKAQLIDGQWVDAGNGGTWDVLDPATEEKVATVPFGDRRDVERAIEAALAAFPAWSRRTPYDRGAILDRVAAMIRERADSLAPLTVSESGKPLAEARGEWLVVADLFEYYAEEGKRAYGRVVPARRPGRRLMVIRQPLGVVGVITAWNFPAYNPARAWSAALAAGNTVVARPSEFTPLTAMALGKILVEAGVPEGVINVVNGDPEGMGQAMLDHPGLRKISFTGSTRVGKILMEGAARTVTRLSLELGGNAPVIILPDVDVEQVARTAAVARFRNAGQVCVAPQRFLVHEKHAEAFTEAIAPKVAALTPGHGMDPATKIGPLINARQRDRVEALVEGARSAGARVAAGGKRPEKLRKGYFYEPTVVSDVRPGMPLVDEETFGPVLTVLRFEDVDGAIAAANRTPYGLAAYVWTRDLEAALKVSEGLEFGMVAVNDWVPHATEVPFSGWKQSGVGHESGPEGLLDYMDVKVIGLGGIPA